MHTEALESVTSITSATPAELVRHFLLCLDKNQVESAVEHFGEDFVMRDNGLDLEFRDRSRFADFLQKRRDLFPEVHFNLENILVDKNVVILQWSLSGFAEAGSYGQRVFKVHIKTMGASIVECDQGRITRWSDYYDRSSSMRMPLIDYFNEYVEI
jgi:limonene-1,2-epoxide hydrolase